MIIRETKLAICAVQFLTRIPTPQLNDFQPEWIQASARYYPAVGMLVAVVASAVMVGASYAWAPLIAAILAVAASMALTGCFHEDGLADTADGIGGGQTKQRRLEIMKDSRLGTYGASVLVMNLMLKVACLAALLALGPWIAALYMVAAAGLGRCAAVFAMAVMPYGGNPGMAKEGNPDRTTWGNVAIAFVVGAIPLLAMSPLVAAVSLAGGLIAACVPALLAQRLLGGRTGDVLGAIEQTFEIGFLLGATALLCA